MRYIPLIFAAILFFAVSIIADVPQIINYQGYLTDSDGNAVEDGSVFIKFKIYGSDMGDDSLWSSGFQSVQTVDGLLSYQMGSFVTLPEDLFSGGIARYLGITIGTDDEISPRTRILSSGYALQAGKSDTAVYAVEVADYSVTGSKIPPNTITSSHIATGTIQSTDVNQDEIQLRVTGDCPPGYYIGDIAGDGTITCFEDQIGSGGDITSVQANNGLTGGATEGDAPLSVGAGNGITVNPDNVEVDITGLSGDGLYGLSGQMHVNTGAGLEISSDDVQLQYEYEHGIAFDSRFVNENQASSVSSDMVVDDDLTKDDISDEPGVCEKLHEESGGGVVGEYPLAGGLEVLLKDTMYCPAAGYVMVIVTFTLYDHGEEANHSAYFGVSDFAGWSDNMNFSYRIADHAAAFRWPITVHGIFPAVEGENVYYFLGDETDGHILLWDVQMSMIYFPSSYATTSKR